MPNTVITVDTLSVKQENKLVIANVSFCLHKGEQLMLTGASGTGKTVLAHAIGNRLFYTGKLIKNFDNALPYAPSVTIIEQRYNLKNRSNLTGGFYYQQRFNSCDGQDSFTVEEELNAINPDADLQTELLEALDMTHRKFAYIIQLSSGEHKKFQIIKAFLAPSQIIIFDEPFIGLDVKSRQNLLVLIEKYTKLGICFILICGSHKLIAPTVTHLLELQKNGHYSFQTIEDFQPTDYQSDNFEINISKIPVTKRTQQYQQAIKMVDVNIQYGEKKILQHINWEVKYGEKWLIQGHNGAGKSTLLSLITGDNPQAYANEIYILDQRKGRHGQSIWQLKKNIGYVSPEVFAYFDKNISVFDTVACGLFDTMGLFRKLNAAQEALVDTWLEVFNLTEYKNKKLAFLSGGKQRIVLLANALIKNPPLLLLDEPCQGLDAQQTKAFIEMVDVLAEIMDNTILYISHYKDEIPNCIDHVLQLKEGIATIKNIQQLA